MNPRKTKLMTNGTEVEINVNREVLEYVREYTYLGQRVSFHKSSGEEIKRRIGLAWNKFWSLKFILLDKYIKLSTKREVFETCDSSTIVRLPDMVSHLQG
jgi:hypothetical protein